MPSFLAPSGRASSPTAATPRTVVLGTTIVAPAGTTCAVDDVEAERLVLTRPGTTTLRCRDALGQQSEPIELEIVALHGSRSEDRSEGRSEPAGPRAVAQVVGATMPEKRRNHRGTHVELGTYAGFHSLAVRRPIALGAMTERATALDDGVTLGLRGGVYRGRLGLEAELGWSALDHVAIDGRGQVIPFGLHGVLRHDEGRASLRLLAGVGGVSLVRDTTTDERDTTVGLSWGGAAAWALGRGQLRFDLRHEVTSGLGGVGQALQATVGVSLRLSP